MSRAFVKEDDTGEAPIVPPRAALPPGTPNYVTPRGLALLREEVSQLEAERTAIEQNREDAADRMRRLTVIKAQLNALHDRLNSAKLVEALNQPTDQVRFGATVTIETKKGGKVGQKRIFTIVGVDEASLPEGRIAFVAPIAKALMGTRVGQMVTLPFGQVAEEVEVKAISFEPSVTAP